MIISVILNIFNYKVIFQCFHYFLFEKQIWLKNFFSIIKQLGSSLFD